MDLTVISSPVPPPERRHAHTAKQIGFWSAVLFAVSAVIGYLSVTEQVTQLKAQVRTLSTQVTTNRQHTFRAISVDCRMLLAHGQAIKDGGPCDDPQVRRYYDPADVQPAATGKDALINRGIDCKQLRLLGGDDPACSDL